MLEKKSLQNKIELVTRPDRYKVVHPLHREHQAGVPRGTQEDHITGDLQEELLVAPADSTDLQADRLEAANSSSRVPK